MAPRWDRPFTAGGVALDVAYAQDSAFLAAAAAHGLHPVDGTAMLVEQAVAQSEMFLSAARAPVGLEGAELRERIAAAMYAALEHPDPASQD